MFMLLKVNILRQNSLTITHAMHTSHRQRNLESLQSLRIT